MCCNGGLQSFVELLVDVMILSKVDDPQLQPLAGAPQDRSALKQQPGAPWVEEEMSRDRRK